MARRQIAKKYKISNNSIEYMKSAFSLTKYNLN